MENWNELNARIAKNLVAYRKAAGLTQAELAEKISYSDKSVSKWEQGNGVPDIYILVQLATLYGVTVNDLIGEDGEKIAAHAKKKTRGLRLLIILLSCGIVWLVATFAFAILELIASGGAWWLAFVYALPVTAILLVVFAGIWKYRALNFIAVSLIIWGTLLCAFLTALSLGGSAGRFWILFLLGVPLQIMEIFWASLRALLKKRFAKKKKGKASQGEKK